MRVSSTGIELGGSDIAVYNKKEPLTRLGDHLNRSVHRSIPDSSSSNKNTEPGLIYLIFLKSLIGKG